MRSSQDMIVLGGGTGLQRMYMAFRLDLNLDQ